MLLDKNPQICTVVNKVLHPAGRARLNNWLGNVVPSCMAAAADACG